MAARRLVLCFDGTWNTPDDDQGDAERIETNVVRFFTAVLDGTAPSGSAQEKWYDTGVGTEWYDRIRGGAFGYGLDQKIRDGYEWLAGRYPVSGEDDQEVFILGFSRGAYAARSLVGMIRNVGLLLPDKTDRVDEAYTIYRNRDVSADTVRATAFRKRYSRQIKITFLGVWDTVGALGIPLAVLQHFNKVEYAFHDTELSGIVVNAAHAVALDEHRIDYQATLWDSIVKAGQAVEQRWFIGAHADVGGGYADRRLSDIALAWMSQKAIESGLALSAADLPDVPHSNAFAGIHDSYADFLGGTYALVHPPYFRPMRIAVGSNQTIDDSVWDRVRGNPGYRPPNPGFPSLAIS
jgi:uncharacterized protein (DUF2235 family)